MQGSDEDTGRMLGDAAGRLFEQHLNTATLRASEQGVWPETLWNAVTDAGLTLALLPEAAGGFGVAPADALKLLRVAAEHAAPVPLAETMLAHWLLARAGIAPPDEPAGPLTFTCADVLRRADGGWRLAGTAARVPWARRARAIAVLAHVEGSAHLALVEPNGWHAEPGENLAREPRDDVRFDHTIENERVRRIDITADGVLAAAAALRTQQIAGALARITAMTVHYAQDRVQFGRPIGKFQAVQQNLAVLAGQSAAALAAADLAADAFDPQRILPIAAAKSRAGEAAGIGAAIAHQMHGAIGFTYEHSLHFLTKRLWSWRDEYGNETFWNRRLGAHLARAGADRLWAEITAA